MAKKATNAAKTEETNRVTRTSATVDAPATAPQVNQDPVARGDAKEQTPALTLVRIPVISDEGDDKERFKVTINAIKTQVNASDRLAVSEITKSWSVANDKAESLAEQLAAARGGCASIFFKFALRAMMRASETQRPETVLAWFDALVETAELKERTEARNRDLAANPGASDKAPKTSEVLGNYWGVKRSENRRSLKAGFDPSKFANAQAFVDASKPAKKERATGGVTSSGRGSHTTNDTPAESPPVMEDRLNKQHPAIAATARRVIQAATSVPEVHSMEAARILNACAAGLGILTKGGDFMAAMAAISTSLMSGNVTEETQAEPRAVGSM